MKAPLTIVVCSMLVVGCVPAPTTTPQEAEIASSALGLNQPTTPLIADKWWTAFGDAQLDGLVEQALKDNPTLHAALARARSAQAALSATRALSYPQITLDGNEQRERFSKNYIIPPPYGGTTQWIGTVQANLSWSLDFFGKQESQIEQARATARGAALDAQAARLLLAGSVTQAFVSLSRADDLIDIAQETVRQQDEVLELTASRVKAGLETAAAERQSQALAAFAREDLVRARADRDLAVHAIALLIGRGFDAYNIARPHLRSDALMLPQTVPADLLARRADIAAAQARVEAATSGREFARKQFYPDINLVAAAGWAAIGLGPIFSASALQYGAGPAIHLPIFDAGKIRADYAQATASLDEAIDNYNASVTSAVKQVADAISDLQATEGQEANQQIALASAVASFDLAKRRYTSGLSPQLNVLSAEDLVIRAKRQSAMLDSDLAADRITLVMALGGGFVPEPKPVANTGLNAQDGLHE